MGGPCRARFLDNPTTYLLLQVALRLGPVRDAYCLVDCNDGLYPVARDNLVMVVGRVPPRRLTIAHCLRPGSWALVAGLAVVWVMARLAAGATGVHQGPVAAFLTAASGQAVRRRPGSSGLALVLSWCAVVLAATLRAQLTSFLAVTSEAPQPQTLAQALARLTTVYDRTALFRTTRAAYEADEGALLLSFLLS
ncbi:Protein of unknown function, partial [Gryllus bimaculatus]